MSKKAIASRNDKFRIAVIESPIRQVDTGRLILTSGIANQSPLVVAHILHAVKNFDEFNEDNDPYGEHDFGKITLTGVDIFFKIDYFLDDKLDCGTDDPLTAFLVLTVMLASEY